MTSQFHITPAVQLACVLAVAGFLPWLPLPVLSGLLLLTVLGCMLLPSASLRQVALSLRKLRWLLLSIAVLYLWFTPGTPVLPYADWWLPTREGFWLALRRVTVLVTLVAVVQVLLQRLSRATLAAAIMSLTAGLRYCGLNTERFAWRLVLSLDAVPGMQSLVADTRAQHKQRGLAETAAQLVLAVENAAQQDSTSAGVMPIITPAPLWQWLLPLFCLGAGIYAVLNF